MAEKEYIEREAALKEFEKVCNVCMALVNKPMCGDCSVADTVRKVKSIPAADVRPVVLCKNCYAYRKDKELARAAYLDEEKYCALLRCEMPEDGYCWYGCPNCGADMREEI